MNQATGPDTDCIADLIPYRCPKCGDRRRFATLRELKHHLESDHSFKTACVRPAIFRQGKNKRITDASGRTKDQSFVITSERLFRNHGGANGYDDCDRFLTNDRMSPLLQSFKDDAAMLELELQMSKQNELRNKTENMRALSGSAINADFRNILDSLNSEVVKTRNQHWNTANELYKSHGVINGLEQAAENKCKEQGELIRQLLDGMKAKERELKLATKEQNEIKNVQERLCHETEELFRRADSHNETIKRELQNRNGALDSLNHEIEALKLKSSQEIRSKENELKKADEKIQRLRSERDQLIEETELILKRADADSEELKLALALKEHKLADVNEELSALRNEKHLMLLKTAEFYKRTEEGNDLMRKIIRAKDDQLEQALEHLEKMKEVQQRLVAESATLTAQADDNTSKMRAMLDVKEQEVQLTVNQLQKLKEEKETLENHSGLVESSTRDIEKLQDKVKKKEEELKTTKGQLQELKSFLKDAAEKERTARGKLEKFIGELITRAERAESELKSLKSQSSSTLGGTDNHKEVLTKEVLHEKDMKARKDRQSLEVERTKPVRRKYTPAKPVRRKYKRDQKLAHDIVDLSTDSWQGRVRITPDSNVNNESESDQSSDYIIEGNVNVTSYTPTDNEKMDKKRNLQTILAEIHRPTDNDSPSSLSAANQDTTSVYNLRKDEILSGNQNSKAENARRNDNPDPNIQSLRYAKDWDIVQKPNLKPNVSIPHPVQMNNYQIPIQNFQVLKEHFQSQSDFDNYSRTEQYMQDNGAYNVGLNDSNGQTYFVPQPPLKDPIRLREPTYGHESTPSLNSVPRVPPHIYNMTPSNKQYHPPTQTNTRLHRRINKNQLNGDQNVLTQDRRRPFQDNQNITASKPGHRLRPITKVIKPGNMDSPVNANEDLNVNLLPNQYVLNGRGNDNMRKMVSHTTTSDDWRNPEQVQYEELHDDEIDFPDELFVIPKSASDELTPDLLTPERERREMKPAIANDWKIQQNDSLTGALAIGTTKERSTGNFERIMDDNGIIWEDMDTLPDVSDSELDQLADRLSPSGSEAIPVNKQMNVPVGNIDIIEENVIQHSNESEDTNLIENGLKSTHRNDAKAQSGEKTDADIEKAVSNSDHIIDHIDGTVRLYRQGNNKDDTVNKEEKSYEEKSISIQVNKKRSVGHKSLMPQDSSSKQFKPIDKTNSGKSSSSEKDLTSGGKEIHEFMSKSPRIIGHELPNCGLDISETGVKHNNMKTDSQILDDHNKVSAILEEKLKLISEKYSLKRHNLDHSDEKDQMQSISDKYRQRRKNIVDSLMSRCSHNNVSSFKSSNFNRSISLPEHNKETEDKEMHSTSETHSHVRPSIVTNDAPNETNVKSNGPQDFDVSTVAKDSSYHESDVKEVSNGNKKLEHEAKLTVENLNEMGNKLEETETQNEVQLAIVPRDKGVSTFQIGNFNEIIQAKTPETKINQSVEKENTNEYRNISAVNRTFPNDHIGKINELEVNRSSPIHTTEKLNENETNIETDSVSEAEVDNLDMNVDSTDPMKSMSRRIYRQNCEMDDEVPEHLQNVHQNKVDHEDSSAGFSIFAEPIDDTCSVGEDSNTQSIIDRSHYIDTDIDLDTDTESHYKGIAPGRGDGSDSISKSMSAEYGHNGQRLKSSRNTMSSASSQG